MKTHLFVPTYSGLSSYLNKTVSLTIKIVTIQLLMLSSHHTIILPKSLVTCEYKKDYDSVALTSEVFTKHN